MCRAMRLLRLLDLLRERGWTTQELAERFGVSQRTIQRDILDLQGHPVYAPLITRTETRWRILCPSGR